LPPEDFSKVSNDLGQTRSSPQLQKKARQQLARSKAAVLPDLPLPGTMARTIVQLIEKIES
jgi:hypothetical protein